MRGLLLAGAALLGALGTVPTAPAATVAHHGPTIQEDDPRWDCRTMGNHTCGPRLTSPNT